MFELIEPHDAESLEAWDEFLMSSPRGQFGQLSTWLSSFQPFGATFVVLLARESGEIRAGMGILLFGNRWLGWATCPSGPVAGEGHEDLVPGLIARAVDVVKARSVALFQIQIPRVRDVDSPALLPERNYTAAFPFQEGQVIDAGAGAWRLRMVEFPQVEDPDEWREGLLAHFNSTTRRNVRLGERSGVQVARAASDDEIEAAYAVIERNGREQGYATRRWRDFGPTLIEQVRRGQALLLTARHADYQETLLGAHYSVLAGRRCTYMMGGTVRTKPDLKVGHFLHWSAMVESAKMGAGGYDFSSGGPPGVERFKEGFRPRNLNFLPAQHLVVSQVRTAALIRLRPLMRRYKPYLARLGGYLRRSPR